MVIDTPESLKSRLAAAREQEEAIRRDCLAVVHEVAVAVLHDLRTGDTKHLEEVVNAISEALGHGD